MHHAALNSSGATNATDAVLRVEHLRHAVNGEVLFDDLSFTLPEGAFASLLGPSGCGKTTLLRLVAGLEPLQGGRIAIAGQVVADAAARRHLPPELRRVGMVFQDFALFPHLSVRQNVLFGLRGKADTPERRQWVEDMLWRFGLGERADAHPPTLSGGEQQRVALLRALAPNPRLLLLDEPFSSLDVARRLEMREETLDIIRASGATALMVTHDAREALFMSDIVLVMKRGRLVQQGSPVEIHEHPADPFVLSLFGHVNRLDGRIRAPGRAETVIGTLPASTDLPVGSAAEVLVRANAFHPVGLVPEPPQEALLPLQVSGQVVSAHFMGSASHLHIAPESAPDIILHAQPPGRFLPAAGERITFRLRRDGVFTFPASSR